MMRTAITTVLLAAGLGSAAVAADWVYVYEDGKPVAYSVGAGFEFQHVDDARIDADNEALLDTVLGYGPWRADVGYGATEYNNTVDAAEHYGRRRGGTFVQDIFVRDYLSPGDWQGLFGDYCDPGAGYVELDKSGPHWSLDATAFSRWGWVYGLDAQSALRRDERRRRQGEFTWRRGSMDGGVWLLRGQAYELNVDAAAPQADDIRHRRGEAGFRAVESQFAAEGAGYYGRYSSTGLDMDNRYLGGRFSGTAGFSRDLVAVGDVDYRSIDAERQNGTVTRLDATGAVEWFLNSDTRLIARARGLREDSGIAAGSLLTGATELGGGLLYHPEPGVWVSADYRRRDFDLERLALELPAVAGLVGGGDAGLADELQQYRVAESAASDRYELRGKCRVKRKLFLSGSYVVEDFSKLPAAGELGGGDTRYSYYADERQSADMRLRYNLGGGANVQLSGNNERRDNGASGSSYELERYAFGYSGPLTGKLRWTLGLSRHETAVSLAGPAEAYAAASWNYDVSLASYGDFADYRVTWARQTTADAPGGHYHGVGLELTLAELPVSLNAWYRKRTEALGGFSDYEDSGITVAYHFELR